MNEDDRFTKERIAEIFGIDPSDLGRPFFEVWEEQAEQFKQRVNNKFGGTGE